MSNKTVLLLPGDGPGNAAIKHVSKTINAVAPDVEVVFGDIGFSAYSVRGEALPERTSDLIASCDGVLCGHIEAEKLDQRNPLDDISIQFGLRTRIREYFTLPNTGVGKNMDMLLIGSNPDHLDGSVENEELSGITATSNLNEENIKDVVTDAVFQSGMFGRDRISFISGYDDLPVMDEYVRKTVSPMFEGCDIGHEMLGKEEAMYRLVTDPGSVRCAVCGHDSFSYIEGFAKGMCGGSGLMAEAIVGSKHSIVMPSYSDDENRLNNPTAAMLSAGLLLMEIGERRGYEIIREIVSVMYREKWSTSDVGGCLTPSQFWEGSTKLIEAYNRYA
ncbi:MAG: isocitrate/isopropylmalate family dehydrogenase [archaeon]|nr:isocitrate/isopropylmalate family dehydrogenase [archaeon]